MKKLFSNKFLAFFFATAISGGCFLLALNVLERKQESRSSYFKVIEIPELEDDPAVWGQNFPSQYHDYLQTVDQVRTIHGGSESIKKIPTQSDPRDIVSQSKLIEDPRLVIMWSGYAFSKDFREERGHAFMLEDQLYTERQKVGQPGACLNCHASTYTAMMKLGEGDLNKGFHELNAMPYFEAVKNIKHPVSCIDCHDTKTMALRISRPAFITGIKEYKKSQNVHDYDVNKMASRHEMRTFVCAQCHVEYYLKGKEKTLTYPWAKGIKADEILSYYNDIDFKDWTHNITNASALKAQHPEFEMWSQGVHAKAKVSCVDCHMPYKREGAVKITDHHVRSPMLNINRACQSCHNVAEEELLDRVTTIQGRHLQMRDTTFNALISLINKIKKAQEDGVSEEKLLKARSFQRDAQFLFDFVEAENSTGFHAPQEAARVMLKALDNVRLGEETLH